MTTVKQELQDLERIWQKALETIDGVSGERIAGYRAAIENFLADVRRLSTLPAPIGETSGREEAFAWNQRWSAIKTLIWHIGNEYDDETPTGLEITRVIDQIEKRMKELEALSSLPTVAPSEPVCPLCHKAHYGANVMCAAGPAPSKGERDFTPEEALAEARKRWGDHPYVCVELFDGNVCGYYVGNQFKVISGNALDVCGNSFREAFAAADKAQKEKP